MSPAPSRAGTAAALAPALLSALFGLWCGTSPAAASFAGAVAGEVALLAVALTVLASAPAIAFALDPLRLGRAGRLLPAALWLATAASAWASPVPRASRTALALLPAFLLLPAAVARCWRGERERRIGLRALAAIVGLVSALSLLAIPWLGTQRASLPLGHHVLLASWLVLLLPLVLLPARERGRWRWVGWGGGVLSLAAILASRSLAGVLALAVEGALALLLLTRRRPAASLPGRRGLRWALLLAALAVAATVLLALQLPRLRAVLAGSDPSLQARLVYLRGGCQGFLARPLLGWGPGSTPWTMPAFLRPAPGVNPPGEVVGELHSLPLQILYELGGTGGLLALGLVAAFVLRRRAEWPVTADRPLLAAGLAGLCGGTAASLASGAWAVTALPVAAAVVAGACLAASAGPSIGIAESSPAPAAGPPRRVFSSSRLLALAYVAAVALALAPAEAARRHYERAVAAVSSEPGTARRELGRAARLDPAFPLYRARLALLADRSPRGRAAAAALAREAAQDAPGVGALWLIAGLRGGEAGSSWAPEALRRACSLDPLSPLPPFRLVTGDPAAAAAPALAARALLAEPRLAAATFWVRRPDLLARAATEVLAWPGVDPGYRLALAAAVRRAAASPAAGERTWFVLELDQAPALSLSLQAFRRAPWPATWQVVRLRQALLAGLDLPAATVLPTSAPSAFSPCPSGAPADAAVSTRLDRRVEPVKPSAPPLRRH